MSARAATPTAGEEVTIKATVHNKGTADASSITVQFADTTAGGTQIGSDQTIVSLAVGQSSTVQVTYDTTDKEGDHEIKVAVDPGNVIVELDESDNQATKTLTVKPPSEEKPNAPNLVVTSSDISFDPEAPAEGEPVVISTTVHNKGTIAAANVEVSFALMNDDEAEPIGETQVISTLAAGSSEIVSVTLDTADKEGEQTIRVTADEENKIPESDETDNQATKTLTIGPAGSGLTSRSVPAATDTQVNLVVAADGVSFQPLGVDGEQVAVSVVVRNVGGRNAEDVSVQVVAAAANQTDLQVEGEQRIASIPAGGSGMAELVFDAVATGGALTFQVRSDPGNLIAESNKVDNGVSAVFAPTEEAKADRPPPPPQPPAPAISD
ncbi:MAG: hypothetical protein HC802_03495 [Caldilineaceae bacterium]|nr:hypothetical protein [Caldilineaceae bacterium]